MQVTIRRATDLRDAAKRAAAAIKVETETSISVHHPDPVRYVRERELEMRERLNDWIDLTDLHYGLRDLIGRANATHDVSAQLARKNSLDEQEKYLQGLIGGRTPRQRSMMALYGGGEAPQSLGHEAELTTLPAAIKAAQRRLETVTSGDATQRLTIPAFSETTLAELAAEIRDIQLRRAECLEKIARINVTQTVEIPDAIVTRLQRHKIR